MAELQELKATCLFTDEDVVYLRLSYDILKDQAEEIVRMWKELTVRHTHLARYRWDRVTGETDAAYSAAVGKRYVQWVLDTARAEYDQDWLDYHTGSGFVTTGPRRTSPTMRIPPPTFAAAT